MAVIKDPDGQETQALLNITDFTGKRVLEIGSGDGRLTWRYADLAIHVDGLDPKIERIQQAQKDIPVDLRNRVNFQAIDLEMFYSRQSGQRKYDLVLLSWAL
jgi:2-polyprenyl-3-methyl-5-hydroxy-6-metoxy-1,4-benzoquinol methylase